MSTLDNLRREAKHWLKALRDQQPSARARLKAAWPSAPADPVLRDIQHALAREHGFESWAAFKAAIASGKASAGPATTTGSEPLDRFLGFACWDHHTHGVSAYQSNERAAMRLLAQISESRRVNLPAAVVCGDLPAVVRMLTADPALAVRKTGPRGWEPLLYLCYARLPLPALNEQAVAIARALLDAGANPNAYYMAGAAVYSALVGVAGEGEQDAPRHHPYKEPLYRLLLERGAGPYDIQVLYNTHFSGDMLWWLELTYAHDAARGDVSAWSDPAWPMLDMGGYGPGAYFVLRTAVRKNDLQLAAWALTHGAGPNVVSSAHPKFKPNRTHYQEAVCLGHTDMATLLQRHGATPLEVVLEGEEAFVQACLRMDRAQLDAMAAAHPEYLRSTKGIFAAAERDRADVVELLLDLGVPIEIEDQHKQRPLHVAAGSNALNVAKLLIARGAEIDPRETQWNATPLGYAVYGNIREMIDLLKPHTKSVWHLVALGDIARLRDLLREDPRRANDVSSNDGTPLMWLPDDEAQAAEIVDLLLAHGADPTIRTKHERMTAADYARNRGLEAAARKLDAVAQTTPSTSTPTLQRFESLAKDLVVAYESGEPGAIQRLVDQFGGQADWEKVRAAVQYQLRSVAESELPSGYFALPHARLVVARQAGFQNWHQLLAILGNSRPPDGAVATPVPDAHVPDLGPGMIQPIEIKAGLRVKMRDGSYSTTTQVWRMLTACRNGDLEDVMELASANAGLILCDYNYMVPLHLAVREGHYGVVQYLVERGAANPNYVTYPYRESLPTLARDRGYEEIARLLERWYEREDKARPEEEGGEIEYDRDEERVRFQRLVNLGAMEEVQALLARRPELALDEFAFWSEGILSMPANRGHRRMIELLLEHGARVPQVTKWGAWYYFKHYEIAALLLERGMSAQHMNCHHTTLLHDMAYTGDVRKAALLLEHGADLDAVDEEFRSTPLGLAARFGKRDMVEFLLDRRADPNRAAASWATPLEWAKKKGHGDIERALLAAGAHAGVRPRRTPGASVPRAPKPEPDPIRVNPPRWMPVRPELAEIEREVEREGGGVAARLAVARGYGADSWERLVLACRLIDAMWRDDVKTVREIITAHPRLLHEDARIRAGCNWGPPMSYAANIPRNRIIRALHELGATDHDSALDRAILQGEIDTARMLLELGAQIRADRSAFDGAAETLNAQGMAFLIEAGAELTQETAPIAMVLETYGRNPLGKHQILELLVRHGISLPDTPPMAVHRGRLDLLERHLRRDSQLFSRTFTHAEIFPPDLGCHTDESLALHGTPLGGAGLLAMCIEYDETEMAGWMIERGADVNLKAALDADGFGGHTPIFHCAVTTGGGRNRHGKFAQLLLSNGADLRVRASLRKAVRFTDDESVHEYRNVTALEWGEQFHERSLVNEIALRMIRERSK